MNFNTLVEHMIELDIYSIFLIAGSRPMYRRNGISHFVDLPKIQPSTTEEIVENLLHQKLSDIIESGQKEINFSRGVSGKGRFRINAYIQRGTCALSIRRIKTHIPQPSDIGIPPYITHHINAQKGLIICAGNGSSGKSTTLASLIDHRNRVSSGYILTIEDPIEYIFHHEKGVIAQREIGIDANSVEEALSAAQLQSPDLTAIGEIRNANAMQSAIHFAESGQLCVTTIRTPSVIQTIERIIGFYEASKRETALNALANTLRCIICQQLIPDIEGNEFAIYETLSMSPTVRDAIRSGNLSRITDLLNRDDLRTGCQSFDASILAALRNGNISPETAVHYASNPESIKKEISRMAYSEILLKSKQEADQSTED